MAVAAVVLVVALVLAARLLARPAHELGGVRLTPTNQAFRTSCQQVADQLGFAIPCPGLLPTSPPDSPPPQLCEDMSACEPGRWMVFAHPFAVPSGYVGALGGSDTVERFGALVVVAVTAQGLAGDPALGCRNERQIATPTVQGTPAVLAACVDDPRGAHFSLGGHVLLQWSQQDTLVTISVRGHSKVNQRLVVALADQLHLVPPRS
ncbi:MAG: hypothetical protein ACJ75A_23420 [Actinomycetes bacterium]